MTAPEPAWPDDTDTPIYDQLVAELASVASTEHGHDSEWTQP